jgi:hypothetical protein
MQRFDVRKALGRAFIRWRNTAHQKHMKQFSPIGMHRA